MRIEIKNIETIGVAAKQFVESIGTRKVFAFYGEMGAGKTTFIKAVCKELGVTEIVSSPTFAIINEYKRDDGDPIYHFDFYRIRKLEEVFDFGYEDYLYSSFICFIEWPELVEPILPPDTVRLSISEKPDGSRVIESVL